MSDAKKPKVVKPKTLTPQKKTSSSKKETAGSPLQKLKAMMPSQRKGTGRQPVYDWEAIRLRYTTTDVTLEAISLEEGGPALQTIKDRASKEGWTAYRQHFQDLVKTKMAEHEAELAKRLAQTELEAVREVRSRQAKLSQQMQAVGRKLLNDIVADEARMKSANLNHAVRLLAVGMTEERKARGMEEFSVNLADISTPEDLDRLTVPQLLELLNRRRKATGFDSQADYASSLPDPEADGG